MSNATTITNSQIRDLRSEAGSAGDSEQVDLCTRALDGNSASRAECERVIRVAELASSTDLDWAAGQRNSRHSGARRVEKW